MEKINIDNIEAYLEKVQLRADKIVDKFVVGFFILGLCLAPIYDTWKFTLITSSLTTLLYLIARFILKNKLYARMIIGIVFGVFMLQFIGQMHGMAEIHFFFFTNIAVLMIYQDWRIMVPYTILAIVHHSTLAFLQWYMDMAELGLYFISYTEITFLQLGFHFGLVALMGVISGLSAYFFRENSIKAYNAQLTIQKQNDYLKSAEEEIRQNFEELQATQEQLLALQAQEQKANQIFRALFEYSSNPHLLFDENGIIDCNNAAVELLGYSSKKEMLNLHPAKLSPEFQPDGRTSAEKSVEMDKLAREKGVHRFEWIHQKADGTNFPVEVTLNPIKLVDRNNVLLVVWRDLTEIKKEQEQIKMLSMVASKTANAVVITDRNGKIEWVNKSFTTISGYTFDEVMGRKPGTFLQGKDTNPDHVANIRQGLKDKLSFSQEILNYNKQGNPYWIDLSITPILDEKGEIKQYFGIETDITERKANEEAIKKQFKLLADKNKKIADSINYAKRIQEALLPRMAQIQTSLPESFVLFMPKDNISGDFYWFAEKEGIQIIIAADCTGHGVPGAFMSMLGISLLNQIVHDKEIHQPHLILDMMHAGVEEMLNQKYEEIKNRDGMDMSICVIDRIKNVVHFAGANNPMYVVSKNKLNFVSKTDGNTIKIKENNGCILTEIKGDKKSIGGRVIKKNTSSYRKQTFKIDQETHIYLFSDGFADQLGGAENLKLMGKGLKELIFKYHQLPPSEQKNAFTTFFTEWIGENKKQIDDVLLVGLKVKP